MLKKIIIDPADAHKQKRWIASSSARLYTVLALIVLFVSISNIEVLLWSAGILTAVVLWAGTPFRYLIGRMLLLIPFGLGAILLLPFTVEGETLFRFLGFAASVEGAERSAVILLKMTIANLLISYLLATTPLFDLIKSLRAIRVPAVMIEMMSLMMRYFFLLAEEVNSMLKAQKSRGFRPEGWLWSRSTYRRFGELLGVLFIRAYSRSQRIYLSMSARGGYEFQSIKHPDGYETRVSNQPKDSESRAINNVEESVKMSSANLIKDRMALHVQEVSYRYADDYALKNVSLKVNKGSKVALMGPNGAGKSTLISLLNGIETPEKGIVEVLGQRVDEKTRDWVRQKVGVVYQDPDDQIFSATVEEDVAFGPRNLGCSPEEVEERVHSALGAVGMREHRTRSPFELSYGQKRRVAIAGVLAMRPEILILDEPMAFLDPKGRDDLQALLESMHYMGLTIIVATHDVDFAAEWADDVIIIKKGTVLTTGTTDLLFEEQWIREADLHLPRLARPFRMLQGLEETPRPKTVKQAAQMIWRLVVGGAEKSPPQEAKREPAREQGRERA